MAYDKNSLSKMAALEALALRLKSEVGKTDKKVDDLTSRVDELVTAGGEPNVLTAVKVNGTAVPITDKAVDIAVPTKVSDLDNDGKFQSETQVATAIQTAIAATGHASFQKADAVPAAEDAEANVLYLVMNDKTKHYDIYAKVGEEVVLLDDTTVDVSGKVDKEEGKGLSTNDYTDEDKAKLAGFVVASDEEVAEMLDSVFGASDVQE